MKKNIFILFIAIATISLSHSSVLFACERGDRVIQNLLRDQVQYYNSINTGYRNGDTTLAQESAQDFLRVTIQHFALCGMEAGAARLKALGVNPSVLNREGITEKTLPAYLHLQFLQKKGIKFSFIGGTK